MRITRDLYRPSLALLNDLYQLTMAYGYWKTGIGEREAVFNLFFRKPPFQGGYTIACGLAYVVDFLEDFGFATEDLDYLATLRGDDDTPLFEEGFLRYLQTLRFAGHLDAVPEGTVVFPHEPLLRVRGPLIQAQLIETFLLNTINFQSLIATKAARIHWATRGQPVLEFGLRRAQGSDGALAASRAAYIGGADATSNVLAGRLFGIPVRGTHAHSWVMSFDSEPEAFRAYAAAMPNNCIFLVDTYDTLEGVHHAIAVGHELRAQGHRLQGIRLDSGDLAYLSTQARQLLDAAGFADTVIVASNDLDEHIIRSLKDQGAAITVWGVGTKLVTAYDQPALGGVYKLAALRRADGTWEHKIKLSGQAEKINNPGIQQVRRYRNEQGYLGDMIYDELAFDPPAGMPLTLVDPGDYTRRKKILPETDYEDLLVPVFRDGQRVYEAPALAAIKQRVADQLAQFHPGIKRFVNPHAYPAGLELSLFERRLALILALKKL